MRWGAIYRVTVVILLALILAQLAGLLDLRTLPHDTRRFVRDLSSMGLPEEAPAPPAAAGSGAYSSGIERFYSDSIEAGIQRRLQEQQEQRRKEVDEARRGLMLPPLDAPGR